MAVTASVIGGVIQVGDETAPDFSIVLLGTGGTITESVRQKLVVAGASTTVLSFGGVVKASLVWISCTDSSGDPKQAKVLLNGSATIPEITELLLTSKTPTTGFTSVSVINDIGASAALTINYAVAG